jgi:DNA (cytosine-5)-methyltransferase 1
MADGQQAFGWRPAATTSALRPGEIVVDLFAGGGGASEALMQALGRDPDVAINHDAAAIGLHSANHPYAKHLQTDMLSPRELFAMERAA